MSPIACGLFFVCVTVQGLNFPGKCPIVPQTHFPEETVAMQIVYGTSFPSGRPSYLFRSFNIIQEQYSFTFYISNFFQNVCHLESKYMDNTLWCTVRANISTFNVTIDKSLVLTSSWYHTQNLLWLDENITEEVRLWFVDRCVILWSCKNNESDNTHDPALLLMAPWKEEEYSLGEYRAWMNNFSTTSMGFLSNSSILKTIDWGLDIEKTMNYNVSPDCKGKRTYFGNTTIYSGKYVGEEPRNHKTVEKYESVDEKRPMTVLFILGIPMLTIVVFVIVYNWENEDEVVEPPTNTHAPVRRAWEI